MSFVPITIKQSGSIITFSTAILNFIGGTLSLTDAGNGQVDITVSGSSLSASAPNNVGTVASAGVSASGSASDHVHALSFATLNTILGTANASISVNSQKIISLLDPTSNQDAATKNYVDTHIISLTSSAPSNISFTSASVGVGTTAARFDHIHLLTFSTVNSILGAANANISVNNQKITSLANPTSAQDSVTKTYNDAVRSFELVLNPISTIATSSNPLIIGAIYFDPHTIQSQGVSSIVFLAHFETVSSSHAANIDFYDRDGVTNSAVPITISGTQTTTSMTGGVVQVDITTALNAAASSGLFQVRLWSSDGSTAVTCNYAALIIT